MPGTIRDRNEPIGEYRTREHLWSRIDAPFDGTSETIPHEVGGKYEDRPILSLIHI